jgi:hypothetical protein
MSSKKCIPVEVARNAEGALCYRFPGAPHVIRRFDGHVHFHLVLGEDAAGCRFASGSKPNVTLHGSGYPADMLHRNDFKSEPDGQSQSMRWRNRKGQTGAHSYRVALDIRDAANTPVPTDHSHSSGDPKTLGHEPVIRNEPEA